MIQHGFRFDSHRQLQLNHDSKERVNESKVADKLIKDIKGLYIYIRTSSNSPIKEVITIPVIPFPPLLLQVDYPIQSP
jgi:hypothetical protein